MAVVGAGASALDMAINALKANEGQPASVKLHWLLRQPKHFGGFDYADLLLLTIFQVRCFAGQWLFERGKQQRDDDGACGCL